MPIGLKSSINSMRYCATPAASWIPGLAQQLNFVTLRNHRD
jgi:hypothetical protein